MNFFYHLKEIKLRFFYINICFFFSFLTSFLYMETILFLIVKPLNTNFIFMNLLEGFFCFSLTAFFLSFFFCLFFIYYSIFDFLKTGLTLNEKFLLLFIIRSEIVINVFSIFFSYNIFLPLTINFFLSFEQNKIENFFNFFFQPKLLDYINFFWLSIFVFILIFQLPLLIFLSIKTKLVKNSFFIKFRREFIILFFVIGCVFSSPDVYSQIFIALPCFFLYEITIFWFIFNKNFGRLLERRRGGFAKPRHTFLCNRFNSCTF